MIILGVFWGYHHLRKHPIYSDLCPGEDSIFDGQWDGGGGSGGEIPEVAICWKMIMNMLGTGWGTVVYKLETMMVMMLMVLMVMMVMMVMVVMMMTTTMMTTTMMMMVMMMMTTMMITMMVMMMMMMSRWSSVSGCNFSWPTIRGIWACSTTQFPNIRVPCVSQSCTILKSLSALTNILYLNSASQYVWTSAPKDFFWLYAFFRFFLVSPFPSLFLQKRLCSHCRSWYSLCYSRRRLSDGLSH